ncbi:MAG: HlyD family type I secretion periplasmic adaptor subunit [Alphaproteobacteria bacterium]|nr:HlyD family type I secretion periplasmic adaptor subunit [Alphaproteobacteria bacterium]
MNETPPDTQAGSEGLTHAFFGLCALLVAAFFVWSYYGKLDVVSAALGEVIPSTQVKHIQHLEGGIVREILVREGEEVKKDQPMVSLEPVAMGADVEELNVRITSLKVELARLEAEAAGMKKPLFPADLTRNYPALIKDATAFFKTRMSRIENQLAGQREQVSQQERMIDEISARLNNNRQQLNLLNEQIGISKELLKDQLSNRMQHLNLLKEASRLKGKIGEDTAGLKRTQAARKGAKNKLETIRDSFREKVQEDMEKKRRSLEEYTNRQRKYTDTLKRTVLRSPVDGVVKTLYVATVGGVVAPGATVADVVPGGDRLIIEAQLPTQDIGYVHAGQEALVMLASSDAARFGNIKGKVTRVSPDAIENADGLPFYKIRITTRETYFQRGNVKYRLFPGVQVTASIRTGQRSVLAYLTDPFLGSFQTALRER